MRMKKVDVDYLVIGAGIMGLSIAKKIIELRPHAKVMIIEKEREIGVHASGRNSGVLHAGFYYYPDSLKAKFTRRGNEELVKHCERHGLKINKCGKVIVAKSEEDLEILHELKRRGDANGVVLEVVDEKELREIEPNAKTYKEALWSPNTAVVDPKEVISCIANELKSKGVMIELGKPYVKTIGKNAILAKDVIIEYGKLINTAGLCADKIAKDFGFSRDYILIPFKGLYLSYRGEDKFIRTNIYPVPDIKKPFLGVHFTIRVDGKIKLGPTAMPCFWRENYSGLYGFKIKEFVETTFWNLRLLLKNSLVRATALEEFKKYIRSFLISEGLKLIREMRNSNLWEWAPSGIRAQLVNVKTFELVQDFIVEGDEESVHILNAVSPAFTASLPFARYVVENYILNRRFSDGKV
ncbi:MAG: L-2-hydroxyglutarate oxidase [candidate division WOR-3 bacterium]